MPVGNDDLGFAPAQRVCWQEVVKRRTQNGFTIHQFLSCYAHSPLHHDVNTLHADSNAGRDAAECTDHIWGPNGSHVPSNVIIL